jgi:hypothetical protein
MTVDLALELLPGTPILFLLKHFRPFMTSHLQETTKWFTNRKLGRGHLKFGFEPDKVESFKPLEK